MPEKLDRCVSDLKSQGKSDDSSWAICKSSTGEAKKTQEKVNANRQVPFFNPPLKKGKIEPKINKNTKGIGGMRSKNNGYLWKQIFDSQLKRDVK